MRQTRPLLLALATLAFGACAAVASTGTGPAAAGTARLTADPTTVHPGGRLELHGSGFPVDAHLTLLAGAPHGRRSRIGSAITGRHGTFVATIRVRSRAAAGAFVALACHDGCRVNASVRFRIVTR